MVGLVGLNIGAGVCAVGVAKKRGGGDVTPP